MNGRRIKPAVRKQIAKRYAKGGGSLGLVGAEFGVSSRSVARILAENGLKVRPRSFEKLKARVVKLYAKGKSLTEVAAETGCSLSSAWRYVNARGKMRNRVGEVAAECRRRALQAWKKCGRLKVAARESGLGMGTVTKYVKESGAKIKRGRPKAGTGWAEVPERAAPPIMPKQSPSNETQVQRRAKAWKAMRARLEEANRKPEGERWRALVKIASEMDCAPATAAYHANLVKKETSGPVEAKPKRRTSWLFCPFLGGECLNATNCTDRTKPPANSCLNAICTGIDRCAKCNQREKCGPERSLWKCWKAGKSPIPLPSDTRSEMLP